MATLLVVEDERDTRDLLARIVRRAGHTAVAAANGWEALIALDETGIDVILLDLMMPGMDGVTFLEILRHDEARRSIPVILVTACDEGALLSAAVRLGVFKCFKKANYTSQELLDAIDQALAGIGIAQQKIRDDLAHGSSPQ